MSNEPKNIAEVIEFAGERFKQIAPQHMKYDAEKGFAIQLLKNNDYLMGVAQSSPASLQQAITNVAAIGLSLNPAAKEAYLITRTIKTKDSKGADKWESRIFLEPSYVGLCKLATDSGSIEWVHAAAVHANDDFIDNGPGEKPTHKYQAFRDRGEMVGVFCTAKTTKGDYLTNVMDMQQIISVRDRSEAWKKKVKEEAKGKTYSGGPWETDFKEMARKTVVRNAFKLWPRTDERRYSMLAEAVSLSNENEGFETIQTTPNIRQPTPQQKEHFDHLLEKGDALGMFAFARAMRDIDDGLLTNLYHSFPKGQKGKYQKLFDDLCGRGQSIFMDIVDGLRQAIQTGDEMAAKELTESLADDVLKAVESAIGAHDWAAISEMVAA